MTIPLCLGILVPQFKLLKELGFTIHDQKSSLVPTQSVTFLGFTIDSISMSVYMTKGKADKVKSAIQSLLKQNKPVIREVASVVGLMVSSFPGVRYGPLFYRALENEKTDALKANGWELDDHMHISDLSRNDLKWWLDHVDSDPGSLTPVDSCVTLKCDSSLEGWGSVLSCDSTSPIPKSANGRWCYNEREHHINFLEIKAILLGLQSLCSAYKDCTIAVLSDNQTAVAYIRNMGGTHSRECNQITRELIMWCKERNLSLIISHIPGKLNVEADRASRQDFHDDIEWSLDKCIFDKLVGVWGKPDIDLFATRLNAKLPCYVSWKADPGAMAIDAFTISWSDYNLIYCFPPFSLIGRVLQKISQSQVRAIIVLPDWPTQCWYPQMLKLLIATPIKIKLQKSTLTLPHNKSKIHPLYPKLQMIGCLVSGKASSSRVYGVKH